MREPLDRVISIFRFMLERIPFAFGSETSAHILRDANISSGGGAHASSELASFVVRSARENHRKFSVSLRAINIGAKSYAIAHFYCDAALNNDGESFIGAAGTRGDERHTREH